MKKKFERIFITFSVYIVSPGEFLAKSCQWRIEVELRRIQVELTWIQVELRWIHVELRRIQVEFENLVQHSTLHLSYDAPKCLLHVNFTQLLLEFSFFVILNLT